MNSKDFRIGNYIFFESILSEITGIMREQISFKYNTGGKDQYAQLITPGIRPIKITEEWLLKFGFSFMPESEYALNTYVLDEFQLWNKNVDFSEIVYLSNRDSIEVKSIHQLQNLFFALKGKDLYLEKNNHE